MRVSNEILVSFSVCLLPHVFADFDELALKDRKRALVKLFHLIGHLRDIDPQIDNQSPHSLTLDQISMVYSLSFLRPELSPTYPNSKMLLHLHKYQAVGLSFMLAKECGQHQSDTEYLSPFWQRLQFLDGSPFYFSPYSGQLSLSFPKPHHCSGGILADEMGLGKTIQMLSLIHSNRTFTSSIKSTLIICPLNLMAQWKSEIERCFDSSVMSVCYFYNSKNRNLITEQYLSSADAPDIILTTFDTLGSEHQKGASPLYDVKWHRVVLDEAHYIKEKDTKKAKACYALEASYRWAITGTPIINKLEYTILT